MRDKCQTEKQLYIYEISAKPKMSAFFARTAHSRDVMPHCRAKQKQQKINDKNEY